LFAFLVRGSRRLCGFSEAHRANELIEIVNDTLVETVELGSLVAVKVGIAFDWTEDARGKRGVDALEEFEEDQADRVALREQVVAPRTRQFGDEALGAEFREVVTERGKGEVSWGAGKGLEDVRVDLGGGESAASGYVGEAAKRTRACIKASCLGWSSFKPGMRRLVRGNGGCVRCRS
jgi:hypothetical protein